MQGASALITRSVVFVRQGVIWYGARCGWFRTLHFITLVAVRVLLCAINGGVVVVGDVVGVGVLFLFAWLWLMLCLLVVCLLLVVVELRCAAGASEW